MSTIHWVDKKIEIYKLLITLNAYDLMGAWDIGQICQIMLKEYIKG
jgi:hypothetical protein